jgi:hypothetical protein
MCIPNLSICNDIALMYDNCYMDYIQLFDSYNLISLVNFIVNN